MIQFAFLAVLVDEVCVVILPLNNAPMLDRLSAKQRNRYVNMCIFHI